MLEILAKPIDSKGSIDKQVNNYMDGELYQWNHKIENKGFFFGNLVSF